MHRRCSSVSFHPAVVDGVEEVDISCTTPPRRVLGFLSTIVVIMEKLGHVMTSHLPRLLSILVSVLPTLYLHFN